MGETRDEHEQDMVQEQHHEPAHDEGPDEHSTRGTFIILMAYLVVIVGLWGTIYLTLLSRG